MPDAISLWLKWLGYTLREGKCSDMGFFIPRRGSRFGVLNPSGDFVAQARKTLPNGHGSVTSARVFCN